jgi:FAD/FMN-containing dehydrogenase
MRGNNKKDDLAGIVGESAVFEDPETDEKRSLLFAPGPAVRPRFRVMPNNTEQVQQLVGWANRTGTPLVPVSSGRPHFKGGSTPSAPESVIVDLSRMDQVLKIDRRNRLALIQPGVTHAQLLPELKKEGLRINMPLMPKHSKSVLAGLLEREPVTSPKFQWNLQEPLRSMEIIWGNGDHFYSGTGFFRGEKESDWQEGIVPAQGVGAGPSQVDFCKFVSAAQGSMGIVTWASVKCEVLPKVNKLFFIPSERLENLIDFTYQLLKYRFGDELFIVNGCCLANLISKDAKTIQALKGMLPAWTVVVNLTGADYFPEERVEGQTQDIKDIAQAHGLDMTPAVNGCTGAALLNLIQNACEEPYWKSRYKGGTEEIFFLTTLDKTPGFMETVRSVADAHRFAATDIGIYLQPGHQGVCCHCEFIFPVNRQSRTETQRTGAMLEAASRRLFREGAFFSRPYGLWADMVFNADAQAKSALRKVKNIFDPNHVMNPGKLCF